MTGNVRYRGTITLAYNLHFQQKATRQDTNDLKMLEKKILMGRSMVCRVILGPQKMLGVALEMDVE